MKSTKIIIALILLGILLGGGLYFWYRSVYPALNAEEVQKLGLDASRRYTNEEINNASIKVAEIESADIDDDGILDFHEAELGYNPKLKDTDGNEIPDGIEEITKIITDIQSPDGEPSLKFTNTSDGNKDGIPDELSAKLNFLPDHQYTYEDFAHALYLFQINLETTQQK